MKKELYKVTEIQDEKIIVTPLEINSETSGEKNNSSQEIKNSPGIEVLNPKKLKIEKGSIVHIALSRQIESIAGIIFLFIPVFIAFAVFFLCKPLETIFKVHFSEIVKFLFALISFTASSAIEFFLTRNIKTILSPIIVKIEKN